MLLRCQLHPLAQLWPVSARLPAALLTNARRRRQRGASHVGSLLQSGVSVQLRAGARAERTVPQQFHGMAEEQDAPDPCAVHGDHRSVHPTDEGGVRWRVAGHWRAPAVRVRAQQRANTVAGRRSADGPGGAGGERMRQQRRR